MYDSQTIALNVVKSSCVVDSYTVFDTLRTPVHNTPAVSAALGTRQHVLDLVNYRIAFSRLACCLAYKPRKFARLLFCFAVNNDFIVFCFYAVFAFAFP